MANKKDTRDSFDIKKLKPGQAVKIYHKIKEVSAKGETKERLQAFEGIIIAKKHGREPGATITVRKISEGVGVEKIFPINSPVISKIELIKEGRTRRAKLYFLRDTDKKFSEKKN
ncbi:MAG: 50S ribosomal protein L19 [Candidatus Magasanikbacteria bacterium]|nr:50S ribosomal protein L19 [Candidatus Magasanikbacteria bacterium]